MPTLPARLQHNIIQENRKLSIYPKYGQIIPPVEHCCIQDELLSPHSWKAQGYICSGEISCNILYQPPNPGNDLYARCNHLAMNDDCPGPRV